MSVVCGVCVDFVVGRIVVGRIVGGRMVGCCVSVMWFWWC